MIKYWPQKPSLELNSEVANLFLDTHQKLNYDLTNYTKENLPIDLVNNNIRKKLLVSTLHELEKLVLDIVELNLNINNVHLLNNKILYDLIEKSLCHFMLNLEYPAQLKYQIEKSYYFKLLVFEHRLLLENLLIYLVFGSDGIDKVLFPFSKFQTPLEHVTILLENLLIQVSNSVIFILINEIKPLSNVLDFWKINTLYDSTQTSIRAITAFRNNLIWQSFNIWYFQQPKSIYSARYKVWLFSAKGLVFRYIYASRSKDYIKLSKVQLLCVLCLEVQDVIVPKLENLLLILGRIILYISINILGNSLRFLIRTIISILGNPKN